MRAETVPAEFVCASGHAGDAVLRVYFKAHAAVKRIRLDFSAFRAQQPVFGVELALHHGRCYQMWVHMLIYARGIEIQ
jgi:hypothetical protein